MHGCMSACMSVFIDICMSGCVHIYACAFYFCMVSLLTQLQIILLVGALG